MTIYLSILLVTIPYAYNALNNPHHAFWKIFYISIILCIISDIYYFANIESGNFITIAVFFLTLLQLKQIYNEEKDDAWTNIYNNPDKKNPLSFLTF